MAPPTRPERVPKPAATAKPRAIDTAGIGPTLGRKRIAAAVLMVMAVAVGIAALVTYNVLDRHLLAKQDEFSRFEGSITAVRDTDSEGSSGEVDVNVLVSGGTDWQATIQVGNAGSWHAGQAATVLVDPEDQTVTLPGENYKPDGFDAMFGLLGIACVATLIGSGVWFARNGARLRRARSSAWRTVDATFVESRGENGEKTVVYLPEFSTDQLWSVKGRIRGPRTRVQIAGERDGLVVRLGEDGSLMLAESVRLAAPITMRVSACDEDDDEIAFRLDTGDRVYFVTGHRDRLASDVGDLATVRAATVRLGSSGIVLLQLGLSREPAFFHRLTDRQARKKWPLLVDPG